MAAGKKTGGRKAGVPNKSSAVKRKALVAAGEVIADAQKAARAPDKARKGISPKDMLLDSMRQAWEAAHALLAAARAKKVEADAATDPAEKARLTEECIGLQMLASQQNELAIETATKVAPYEHAKLQNVDGKLVGNLYVNLKQF